MPEPSNPTLAPSSRERESALPDSNALTLFRGADWKRIQLDLTLYAVFKVQRLHWRTGEGLPKGLLPQDLALGAIQKTMEGIVSAEKGKGIRRWNPVKDPDLLGYLKSVVDSDVSSLVNLEEHALNNYCPDITADEAAKLLESSIDQTAQGAAPEALLAARQNTANTETLYRAVMSELAVDCASDEDEMNVLKALERLSQEDEELKTSAIARSSGITEDRVRNAKRRIERKTRLIRERLFRKGAVAP